MRQAYQRAVNDTPNYNDPWPPPTARHTMDTTPEYVVVTDEDNYFIAVRRGVQYDIIGTAVNSYYANRIVKAMKGDN